MEKYTYKNSQKSIKKSIYEGKLALLNPKPTIKPPYLKKSGTANQNRPWNRIKSHQKYPSTYGNVMCDKGGISNCWGKDGENRQLLEKDNKLEVDWESEWKHLKYTSTRRKHG